jgi:S1-C subfamily serine protease
MAPVVRVNTSTGSGSGTIVYSKDGRAFVLTNYHVVANPFTPNQLSVDLFRYTDGSSEVFRTNMPATVFAKDPSRDLALLEIRDAPYSLLVVKLMPEDNKLRLFQEVFIVGATVGEDPAAYKGHITDLDRHTQVGSRVMTSAKIFFGDSGGAAFIEKDGTFYLAGVPCGVTLFYPFVAPQMNHFISVSSVRAFYRSRMLHKIFEE